MPSLKPVGKFLCEWTDSLSTVYGWNLNLLQPVSLAHKVGREFFGIQFPEWGDNIVYSFDIAANAISGSGTFTAIKTQWLNQEFGMHKKEGEKIGEPERVVYTRTSDKKQWTKFWLKLEGWDSFLYKIRKIVSPLFSLTETIFYLMSNKAVSNRFEEGLGYINSGLGIVTSGLSLAQEVRFCWKAKTLVLEKQIISEGESGRGATRAVKAFARFVKNAVVTSSSEKKSEEYVMSEGEIRLSQLKIVKSIASLVHSALCLPLVPNMPRAKLAACTVIWASEFAAFYGDSIGLGGRPDYFEPEAKKKS